MRDIIISEFVGLMFQTTIYGWIPEWPKGTDCKSAATCFDGSNPSLPITLYRVTKYYRGMEQSGSSSGS